MVRRVVSSDGRSRLVSTNSAAQQPPTSRRIVVGRRANVDPLDSSFSESEGFTGEPDPVSVDFWIFPPFSLTLIFCLDELTHDRIYPLKSMHCTVIITSKTETVFILTKKYFNLKLILWPVPQKLQKVKN